MREIGDEDLLSGFKKIAAQLDQVGKIIVICTRGDSEEVENNRRLKTLLNDPELNSVIIHNSTALKAGDLSRVSKIVFGDQLPT